MLGHQTLGPLLAYSHNTSPIATFEVHTLWWLHDILIYFFFFTDDLTIDYQFTFNLSKKEDRHYTQINFKNSPPKPDVDADFSITCSVMAKMNITVKTGNYICS
jgi:hypothetical protein